MLLTASACGSTVAATSVNTSSFTLAFDAESGCFKIGTGAPCDSAKGVSACPTKTELKNIKLMVGGKPKKLALMASDIKVLLTKLPTSGGTVCFDFSKAGATVAFKMEGLRYNASMDAAIAVAAAKALGLDGYPASNVLVIASGGGGRRRSRHARALLDVSEDAPAHSTDSTPRAAVKAVAGSPAKACDINGATAPSGAGTDAPVNPTPGGLSPHARFANPYADSLDQAAGLSVAAAGTGAAVWLQLVFPPATGFSADAIQAAVNSAAFWPFLRNYLAANLDFTQGGSVCEAPALQECEGTVFQIPRRVSNCPVDVCFLMDGSGSISSYPGAWEIEGNIIDSIVTSMGNGDAYISVVEFSYEALVHIPPIARRNADTTVLRSLPMMAGSTNMAAGLQKAIVLLTDGAPDSYIDASEQAEAAKAHGITIVTIGVGGADLDYMDTLSSGPYDFAFSAGAFDNDATNLGTVVTPALCLAGLTVGGCDEDPACSACDLNTKACAHCIDGFIPRFGLCVPAFLGSFLPGDPVAARAPCRRVIAPGGVGLHSSPCLFDEPLGQLPFGTELAFTGVKIGDTCGDGYNWAFVWHGADYYWVPVGVQCDTSTNNIGYCTSSPSGVDLCAANGVVCPAQSGECHCADSQCDPETGVCSPIPSRVGADCLDGNGACNQAGACIEKCSSTSCGQLDQCAASPGYCEASTGRCIASYLMGTGCTDWDGAAGTCDGRGFCDAAAVRRRSLLALPDKCKGKLSVQTSLCSKSVVDYFCGISLPGGVPWDNIVRQPDCAYHATFFGCQNCEQQAFYKEIYEATKTGSRDNLASAFRAVYIPTFYPSKISFVDKITYFFNGEDKRMYWDENDLPTEAKLNECCSKELALLKQVMQFIERSTETQYDCLRESILGWLSCTSPSKFVDYSTARELLADSLRNLAVNRLADWVAGAIGQTTAVKIGMFLGGQAANVIKGFGNSGARKIANKNLPFVLHEDHDLGQYSCEKC
ncbi:hypothetical protein Rsub_13287 [Raphidocelis subcapitata]|uniref:VWFA domain-containing protein n=1 Tax=Raphidocelis subcapitata TaxID=307507 RepID=A0A2V0PKI6_9CHLO|nr:hypothetical protein Rsub_13287 [Raphidocelis subcapitata]|eukprot:GBG00309.1 hypothetical protein Rsub_13287 [Raphidocelis subcapitata]